MPSCSLTDIEAALRASWAVDTCSPDDLERSGWGAHNPALGYCDITALVVHDLFGRTLLVGEVYAVDGGQEGYHWWNRLPSGLELDLTRDQFLNGPTVTTPREIERPAGRLPRRQEEYELLRERVTGRVGCPLPGGVGVR
ncbi:hypothetical protein ACFWZ2_43440 [Streptomyces sp. NPDC059002]|uniref:YunG family protein n=1 Tax=Streptomyces sp. NPDC059002 TaxID=3346690 RepID=UPI00367C5227